jgi:hypothetical protein
MIKKLFILILVLWALYLFYEKYVASTVEPFFNNNTGNVDFLGGKVRQPNLQDR